MPRTRSQAASKIAPNSISQLTSVFDALPEKPRETYTLREAVSLLAQPIRTALSRGYSYNEIAGILAEQGIAISAFSLKRYLSLSKAEQTQTSQAGQGKRRGRQPKASVAATAAPLETTVTPSEAATAQPEAAPKRRGRPKAAVPNQPTSGETITVPADPQPEAEATPKRRGRTSKTAAKVKPAPRTTTRAGKGRKQK